MSIKFLVLGGWYFGVFFGGGECRFYFYGRADFSEVKVNFSNVQTRCIVKGEAQKSPLFWRFSGVFDFLRIACSVGIPKENL